MSYRLSASPVQYPNTEYRSLPRYMFSANGALLRSAWGNAPGAKDEKDPSAESACHKRGESRLQRSPIISDFLGRCPRLAHEIAPLALNTFSAGD